VLVTTPRGGDELIPSGVERDRETTAVGIDIGAGQGGVADREPQRLVGDQQRVDLLDDAGWGTGAQHPQRSSWCGEDVLEDDLSYRSSAPMIGTDTPTPEDP
jgi:hypothetical protein